MLGCRGDTTFSLLRTALNPAHQSHTRGAAALLLALAQTADQQGVPMLGAEYELGMAVSRICVQARAQDWQCRQLGDFDHQRLRQELGVPAGFEPIVVLVVGGNGPAGPDDQAEYGTRLAPEALAFARRWGRPAWTSL
ncbi:MULTISPECIES: hypothetical protein [unclassified Micromonospora]|uniref:hypothetical protein n=1 Tax=unclassified Micromonospora TaxID=2617518 RepID=UPI003A85DB41